jgi:hypothetical protein
MANSNDDRPPVRDEGVPKPEAPYRAGGKQQGTRATRKNALMDAGTIGYTPGHDGPGRGSSAQAGYVHEAPRESGMSGPIQYGVQQAAPRPRPMPREIPVHTQSTHFGNITRYLDGHSEVHRERPGLVEMMNHPDTHPDDKEALRQEIVHRDLLRSHRYW